MLLITLFLAGCGGGASADPQGGSVPIETLAKPSDQDNVFYKIPVSSMEPTLHCAVPAVGCEGVAPDVITVDKSTNIGRGDIVVFKTPPLARQRCGSGGTFVKRVIGLPGDRVELRYEGLSYVYINGKKLDEPYIEPIRRDTRETQTYNVPAEEYFMMGDNRRVSCDSREWGTVPAGSVIGEVVLIRR